MAVVLVTAIQTAVAGCSASGGRADADTSVRAKDTVEGTVLQPGRPGEPAETLPPGTTVDQPRWNDADVTFVQMMIPHHAQALRMCDLARTRAADERVAALARRIAGAQGPEIIGMSAWLQTRDIQVPSAADLESAAGGGGHHAHEQGSSVGGDTPDNMTMPGMLSKAEMAELAAADGARFDELFLAAMIRHHRGAVAMADRALRRGGDIRAAEIAADVSTGQSAEIGRMRDLRGALTG